MLEGRRIAVVVPAYDEERLIARTLRTIPGCVDDVFVVDDGSSDGTRSRALAVLDERVVVIAHALNRGVGAAIATGYRAAFDRMNAVLTYLTHNCCQGEACLDTTVPACDADACTTP